MQVRVYPGKTIEELGAERWQCEWQEVRPEALKRQAADDNIELDMDVDIMTCCTFHKTEAKAKAAAFDTLKRRADWLAFGSIIIQLQRVDWFVEEDKVGEWIDIGEPQYLESDAIQP